MPDLAFLLDASMPRSSAEPFRTRGYDVEDIRDIGLGGAPDDEIIQYARKEARIVVTRDTDFGSVLRHPDHPGAIILRLPSTATAPKIRDRLDSFLDAVPEKRLAGAILVVEQGRYRRRAIR